MRRRTSMGIRAGFVLLTILVGTGVAGCPALFPRNVSVELRNDTPGTVTVRLFYGRDSLNSRTLLRLSGNELNFTIPSGETRSFSRSCDDLQAIYIDNASLNLIGSIGPETDTRLYSEGSDFGCRDQITFRFTSNLVTLNAEFTATDR